MTNKLFSGLFMMGVALFLSACGSNSGSGSSNNSVATYGTCSNLSSGGQISTQYGVLSCNSQCPYGIYNNQCLPASAVGTTGITGIGGIGTTGVIGTTGSSSQALAYDQQYCQQYGLALSTTYTQMYQHGVCVNAYGYPVGYAPY